MKRILFLFLFIFSSATRAAADFRINNKDFRLIDAQGEAHSLSYYSDYEAILLLAWPNACPSSDSLLKTFAEVEGRVDQKKIKIFWLDSDLVQDRAQVLTAVSSRFHTPVLMDPSQTISKSFGLKNGGDFVLIKTAPWKISAQGSFRDLPKALELKEFSSPASIECPLTYRDASHLTFDKAMAQRFFSACTDCHSRASSLDFFKHDADVFQWAAMNRYVLRNLRMPFSGVDYQANALCTQTKNNGQDLSTLLSWLEQGSPHGNDTDFTNSIRQARDAKTLPDPDWVWTAKEPVEIPESGPAFYKIFKIAGPLKEDLYLKKARLQANAVAAEHIQFWFSRSPIEDFSEQYNMFDLSQLKGVVPIFAMLHPFFAYGTPDDSVLVFPKGSYIQMSMHYFPYGKKEVDHPKLTLFFDKFGKTKKHVKTLKAWNQNFLIKKNESRKEVVLKMSMPEDGWLTHLSAHFHRRGTAVRFEIVSGDTTTLLCNFPTAREDTTFAPLDNIKVKKEDKIIAHLYYDNSAQNPNNPDSNADVPVGSEIDKNEMAYALVQYVN